MGNLFTGPHLWIVLIVVVLLFGAAKLPALAKSIGQSARIFRGEVKAMKADSADASPAADAAASTVTAAATPAVEVAGAERTTA